MPLYEHVTGSERVFIPNDMVATNHAEYLRMKNSPDWKQIGVGSTPDPVEEPEEPKLEPQGVHSPGDGNNAPATPEELGESPSEPEVVHETGSENDFTHSEDTKESETPKKKKN